MEALTGLMSGGDYSNASGGEAQAIKAVVQGASIIFGQVFANRNVQDLSINYDDVVAEDIHRDNRSLLFALAAIALTIAVAYILFKK